MPTASAWHRHRTQGASGGISTGSGPLFEQPLDQSGIKDKADIPERAEYAVAVDWQKTVIIDLARIFKGATANQNIVCKLCDQATVDFLLKKFDVDD